MDTGFVTPWWLLLAILAGYIGISLAIGGRKTYFEPFQDPEATEPTAVEEKKAGA